MRNKKRPLSRSLLFFAKTIVSLFSFQILPTINPFVTVLTQAVTFVWLEFVALIAINEGAIKNHLFTVRPFLNRTIRHNPAQYLATLSFEMVDSGLIAVLPDHAPTLIGSVKRPTQSVNKDSDSDNSKTDHCQPNQETSNISTLGFVGVAVLIHNGKLSLIHFCLVALLARALSANSLVSLVIVYFSFHFIIIFYSIF